MRRVGPPALLVLGGSIALELAYGVSLGDALLYIGYELGFVVVPGWAAYRALSRDPGGPLRQLAIGWALGYVLEILAFMATAATGTRELLVIYPLVIVIAAAAIIYRRTPSQAGRDPGSEKPSYLGWMTAAVCLGAIVYIALSYFATTSLPGTGDVSYFIDYNRWIGLAADAKNNWPITDPSVAGEPLPYHYFVNIHLAAASQVTGLGLPLIYLRLFIFPLVTLGVLLLVVAGQSFARSYSVGLIAACIAFFIGELRLDASETFLAHTPFFGLFFTLLIRSPSFLLGLVLFVALIILVGERIRHRPERGTIGEWILIALLMVGASDAKVTILPLLVAALALYGGWRLLDSGRIPPGAWISAGMALLVSGVVWVLQYRGYPSGVDLDPFADLNLMPAVRLIKGDLMANLAQFPGRDVLLDVGGVLFGSLGLLAAPLVGIAWIIHRGVRLSEAQIWLFSLLLAGLALSFMFAEPGTQAAMYFLFFGLIGGYVLSAEGLRAAWRRRPPMRGRWKPLVALGFAAAASITALIALPTSLDLFTGPRANALTYMLRYAGLILTLVLLYAAGRRWLGPGRWAAGALVSAALLGVGALATPFDNLKPALTSRAGAQVSLGKTMSPELYRALTWIRDQTPTDAIVAVNNQWIDPANTVPLEFTYSAFSERRVFLEGWGYSQRTRELGFDRVLGGLNPFADRLELNRSAFSEADPAALGELAADYGVGYLIVDMVNGTPADVEALRRSAEVVYEAPGVLILKLPRRQLTVRGP
jgi:hypothetical protein